MACNTLRCAHCPYSAALWVNRKPVGYAHMSNHVAEEHAEEYRLVRKGLAEIDEDIRRAEEEADGVY